MKTRTAALLTIAGLLSVGITYADDGDSKKGRECLFASQPSSWHVLDDETLVLWGPAQRDAYLVKLFAPVSDMRFTLKLAIIDGDRNGMICGDSSDKVAVPDSPTTPLPTPIISMRKVDDAELLALGEKYKTKLISDKRAEAVKSHDKQIHE